MVVCDFLYDLVGLSSAVAKLGMLNTIFHGLYSVVRLIVFCAKSIVIFVRSVVLLANPEAHSMRYDTTR